MMNIILILALILGISQAVDCHPPPLSGWHQVSYRWPSQDSGYFVATARGHHFIEIKLPRDLNDGDLNVHLEYFYNYTRIRPDVRIVPCGNSLNVVDDEALQPRGEWLVHQMHLTAATCSQKPILMYNIMLHDEGDVFAWRYLKLSRATTEIAPVNDSPHVRDFSELSCHLGHCDEDNLNLARFVKLNRGLPEGVMDRLNRGASVYVSTGVDKILWLNSRLSQGNNSKREICFKLELHMDEGTDFELLLNGHFLDFCQPNWFEGRWFTYKHCVDGDKVSPSSTDGSLMFQLKPRIKSGKHIVISQPLKAAWLEPHMEVHLPGSSPDPSRNTWIFSLAGGSEMDQVVEFEELKSDENSVNGLLVKNIATEATSLSIKTDWMVWSESDADSWFYYRNSKVDWIKGIKGLVWQDERHEPVELRLNDSTDGSSSSIKFKLEGVVGEKYRLKLTMFMEEKEEQQQQSESRQLTISTLAITKDHLW